MKSTKTKKSKKQAITYNNKQFIFLSDKARMLGSNLLEIRQNYNDKPYKDDIRNLAKFLDKLFKDSRHKHSTELIARTIILVSVIRSYQIIPPNYISRPSIYVYIKKFRAEINKWLIAHDYAPINQVRTRNYLFKDPTTSTVETQ
jgi:hypothetical protein